MSQPLPRMWTPIEAQYRERWKRIKEWLGMRCPYSPLTTWTFQDYIDHLANTARSESRHLRQSNAPAPEPGSATYNDTRLVTPLLGKKSRDGYGTVLAMPTIWCNDWIGEGRTPWPSVDEFEWDGDERVKTNFQRYFPPPRRPMNTTVNFKLALRLHTFHFDRVNEPPTDPEDVFLDYDLPLKDDELHFIGHDFMASLDSDR